MKRVAVSAMLLALVFGLMLAPTLSAGPAKAFQPALPSFEKMDPEAAQDAAGMGIAAKGKEFRQYTTGKSYKTPTAMGPLNPIDATGHDKKGVAILVDFPESVPGSSEVPGVTYAQVPNNLFGDLLNGDTYDPYSLSLFSWIRDLYPTARTDGTLKNYFDEVSYGKFGIQVDVKGWYTLPHTYEYYLGQADHYNANGDAHIAELVSDAIDLADAAGVDFSQYAVPARPGDFAELSPDENATSYWQDGKELTEVVPNIFIIHRGTGAEYNLDPRVIWSHKWYIVSASYYGYYYQNGVPPAIETLKYKVVDDVVVNLYNVVPEVGQDITGYLGYGKRRPSPAYVGTYAHEFSHVLGLPDQYDYGYDSAGTGMFSLMASGSWGRDIQYRYFSGNCPVNLDAWSKWYLGFAATQPVVPDQAVTLQPASEAPDVYKVAVPGSDGREYFLLENRQQTGFDKGLAYTVGQYATHGLVVYHVDENVFVRNFHRPNEAGNWHWDARGANTRDPETGEYHYAIGVEQADGQYQLEHNLNDGDAGDVFPGLHGVTTLSPDLSSKTASTVSWYVWDDNRSITGIRVHDIHENPDGTVTLKLSFIQ